VKTASVTTISVGLSISVTSNFSITSASNGLFRSNSSSFYPKLIKEEGGGGWQRVSILFRLETVSVMRFSVGLQLVDFSHFQFFHFVTV
jgi:hypothetical protein